MLPGAPCEAAACGDGMVAVAHASRPHQELGGAIIAAREARGSGEVRRCERLGGLLNHYYRQAA